MAFIDTLIALDRGNVVIGLQEALEEISRAVSSTGKTGKLTLTIDIKPGSGGVDVGIFNLIPLIKRDIPLPDLKPTLFFLTRNGQLSRSNQEQLDLLDGVESIDIGIGLEKKA